MSTYYITQEPMFIYDSLFLTKEINWAHRLLSITEAWASATGKGVKVGVVDTGCDYNHVDIVDAIMGGINCSHSTSGYMDVVGHGTCVASIIAARKTGSGVAGIAPDAKLFIAKSIDDNGAGDNASVLCGVKACIEIGCDVINMSIGSKSEDPELTEAITDAIKTGVIFVAAAGNSGDNDSRTSEEDWPARLDGVISVAAVNRKEEIPEWSASGNIEFCAPGVDIMGCYPGNKYVSMSGTSQAAPFVSGICALLKECNPSINSAQAVEILSKYAISVGDTKKAGAGLINVAAALKDASLRKHG